MKIDKKIDILHVKLWIQKDHKVKLVVLDLKIQENMCQKEL